MENLRLPAFAAALVLLATVAPAFGESPDLVAAEREFALKVLPLLKAKCFACHGEDPDEIEGGLSMLTRDDLLLGGDGYGDVVVPGSAQESIIMTAITWADPDLEMPPKANDRLTDPQVALIEKWIAHGAVWPSLDKQKAFREEEWANTHTEDGEIMRTSGGQSDEWTYRRYQPEEIWAFQPVKKPEIPETFHGNPVDYFVSGKLQAAGYAPAPRTDVRTLARRASLSLVGYLPTPAEAAAFAAADPATAMGDLVDDLLATPHYGERWAQHWLDIARYADTAGMSNDYERSNLWRYRDYVIRSLNDDKPYNQFIVEQLAGDEIWSGQPEDQRDPELLVATGFLRMGSWDPAMVLVPEARQLYIDDVVNSVGQTFLSTTMRCFKCHDHKFDPLPTLDYYRVYATFAGTQLAEREAPFLPEENLRGMAEEKAIVERLLAFASEKNDELKAKSDAADRAWYAENGLPFVKGDARKAMPDELKPPRHAGLDYTELGRLKVRAQDEWIWTRRLERFEPMVQSVYNGADLESLNSRKLRMPAKPVEGKIESFIFTGGSLQARAARVQPGVLSALRVPVDPDADDPYVISEALEGRRLAFANWVADPRNPLTARTIVNRVWQHHFGRAIAGNTINFGAKGQKPTHPELLDWLTADFVENGWKIKRLHKLIMTSAAYQMSAQHPQQAELANTDPTNDLLAFYPNRRLTAEELRDSMLRITGELNPEVGGLPIMPEMNREVALQPRMIQFSIAPAYQPSITPEDRNRRSIYAYRVRGLPDPFLEIFNQPNPNDACERRDEASVSPQAFTMMNSDMMTDRSIAFALRLEKEAQSVDDQIDLAFELAFNRPPSVPEKQTLLTYVQKMQGYHHEVVPDPVTYPTKITRTLVEEFSGQPFDYEEILPNYEVYQPDAKAADVSPETRALADICLLIFNTNEFIYTY
jgi:mono/diheme cytochrome c family protein